MTETTQPNPPTTVDALADLIAAYLRSGSDGDIIGLAHDLEDAVGVEASDALWREAHALAVPGPLFDTPQITTDDAGHWHQGREYVAVDVDGELDYQPKETPVTKTPAPTRPGLTIDHLDFARRLIDTATHAGVAIRYCCWTGWDWDVMTTPELDDAAGTAFLAALDIGDVGEPSQLKPNKNRSILAGPQFDGAVRLWVAPIPTTIDTTEEGS